MGIVSLFGEFHFQLLSIGELLIYFSLDLVWLVYVFYSLDQIVWNLSVIQKVQNILELRRSLAFTRSIKHIQTGLLSSIAFSVMCLETKAASVRDLPDLNPCYSASRHIRLLIMFLVIFAMSFNVVFSKFMALQFENNFLSPF